eukprot:5557996-Pyramimonas_sp.AAC.1
MGDDEDGEEVVAPVAREGASAGRYVPPPAIEESTIEELRKYVRRLRIWSKVATGIPTHQR